MWFDLGVSKPANLLDSSLGAPGLSRQKNWRGVAQYGYHVDQTTGIATGNEPESIYAVISGKHYNDGCCFDVRIQPSALSLQNRSPLQ